MRILSILMLSIACTLGAQDMSAFLPKPSALGQSLGTGEALALGMEAGPIQGFGPARKAAPLGGMSTLLWLQMFGDEWGYERLQFRCKGSWNGFSCAQAKGHGGVDLSKALTEGCTLAFLAWTSEGVLKRKADYGEDVTRTQLEERFRPFMATRLGPREPLPPFGPAWLGTGDLLQASPEQLLRWLLDPSQEGVRIKLPNLLIPLLKRQPGPQGWAFALWAPSPDGRRDGATWVVGSDGFRTAVLYLPAPWERKRALAHFKELLGMR